MRKIVKHKWWIFAGFVLAAALSRLLPHPYNFTPIGGMALFAGGVLSGKRLFWIVPLIAYWLSDLLVMNILYASYYEGLVWFGLPSVYISIILIVVLGRLVLNKLKLNRLIAGSLGASVIFYLVTNFGVWLTSPMYPMDLTGLIACYDAAIPFFQNTVAGDLFYVSILFGSYALITKHYPAWKLKSAVKSTA